MASFKKVVQSAIVMIPPESQWQPIQEIRKVYDKAYARWMPLYPFVSGEHFGDVVGQVKAAVSSLAPFKVTLKKFGYFSHKSDTTMWLDPECEPNGMLHAVQAALEKAFPDCNDLSNISESGFSPHLSVGQFPKNEVKKFMSNFQSQWTPIEFTVSEIYMIHRTDFDSPFQVYYRVPFGNDPVQAITPPPKPKENKRAVTVFVGNLPFSVTEQELSEVFETAGLNPVSVSLPRSNGQSKGFGFVEFASAEDHKKGLLMDKRLELAGRTLSVQASK